MTHAQLSKKVFDSRYGFSDLEGLTYEEIYQDYDDTELIEFLEADDRFDDEWGDYIYING